MVNVTDSERLVGIIIPVVFGVIALIGLIGNLLVIVVVLSDKQMRSTTNILAMSLAVADLFFVIFYVPFTATTYTIPVWPFGVFWCKIVNYMMYVCAYASVYTLVLMSLVRYYAVLHALRSVTLFTERNTYILIIITWVIILLANIPLLVQYDKLDYVFNGENRSTCISIPIFEDAFTTRYTGKIFHGFFFAFGFFIPLVILYVLYGLILKRLLRRVASLPGAAWPVGRMCPIERANRKVTRMVVVVVGIFVICWLPIQVIFLIVNFGHDPGTKEFIAVRMASNCLAYLNSCLNPIIYAFLSEDFRRSYRKRLCCLSARTAMRNA